MEKQESIGFVEIFLRILTNDLKHFKLCLFLVLVPIIVAFVLVVWVIKPTYRAYAIVTPPPASETSLSGLGSMLGSSFGGSVSSILGIESGDENTDAVWTIFNSWELHDQVISTFNLAEHYEFDGKFHADLLKQFRENFGLENNNENMFVVSVEDEDYKLAAKMVSFMLEKADSAFNAYKRSRAAQSRAYFQNRLDSCERALDSLLRGFVQFQIDNDFYEPEIQMEATIKYLGELQLKREEVRMEMSYEKADRGESKRYEQLQKRYQGVNRALNGALSGNDGNVGVVSLKKSPELAAVYMQWEAQIKIQEALYKLLRQQSEQMRMEEAKMLTNLHILEPPWENDKKVYPRRGLILIFVAFVSMLFATLICNFIGFLQSEKKKGSVVAAEWDAFCKALCFWRK